MARASLMPTPRFSSFESQFTIGHNYDNNMYFPRVIKKSNFCYI